MRRFGKARKYGADSFYELHLWDRCGPTSCKYCKGKKHRGSKGLFKDLPFQPRKMKYTWPAKSSTYKLDTEFESTIIEVKGCFVDMDEAKKYIHIRAALEPHEELVFFFMDPYTPTPGAKRRKDGTVRTHAEWAEKNNFRWYDETTILPVIGG